MKFHSLSGPEGRPYAEQLASLRLKVFWDFPYLYEGTLDYERKYLETYFQAKHSALFLIEDQSEIVGASTGVWAPEEEESFRKPFVDYGINPESVFYFGESILLPAYRGHGLGKRFFQERENYARTIPGIDYLSFCAVERPVNHPLKPADYRPLDSFWKSMGFNKEEGLKTIYSWKDRGEITETSKTMQFWLKKI